MYGLKFFDLNTNNLITARLKANHILIWNPKMPEGFRPKSGIGHLGPCQGHTWSVILSLFFQELTTGLGELSHQLGKPFGLKDGLVGPNNDHFYAPKIIGYNFKTSLSLDAKDHNGGRVLCIAYIGPLFIHVDEIMVDQEVVHLVDCAN